jgi:hypothetical protein
MALGWDRIYRSFVFRLVKARFATIEEARGKVINEMF